jgi:hypothetical protein
LTRILANKRRKLVLWPVFVNNPEDVSSAGGSGDRRRRDRNDLAGDKGLNDLKEPANQTTL